MGILFENCDLLLRGEDGVYSTLHGFLGVRGDTIDYIGTEKPTGSMRSTKAWSISCSCPASLTATITRPWCCCAA
ncbi:MAG: hypothetical protein ACLSHJ_02090 [Oscillospiraceae bacterium]